MSNNDKQLQEIPATQIIPADQWDELRQRIVGKHKVISKKKTPAQHIDARPDGYSYVKDVHMRSMANENYGFYNFEYKDMTIIYTKVTVPQVFKGKLYTTEISSPEWILFVGELVFIDEGVPRRFAGTGGSRVQYKKGEVHTPDNIVDIDKQIKAARTNALKDAINRAMNIADDVYKKEIDEYCSDKEIASFQVLLNQAINLKLLSKAQVDAAKELIAEDYPPKLMYDRMVKKINELIKEVSP
jgi:hypothetical protein